MLLYLLFSTAFSATWMSTYTQNGACDGSNTAFAVWTDYTEWSQWGACEGSCGTTDAGTKTRTRSRVCCFDTGCEGASEETNSAKCDLLEPNYTCGDDKKEFRLYDGMMCTDGDRHYAGVAGSIQECMTLYDMEGTDASKTLVSEKKAFMLECYDENIGERPMPCYVCKDAKMEASTCGSRVYLEPTYDWNYAIIGFGLGVGFLTLIGAFLVNQFELCGGMDETEEKSREINQQDPLNVEINEGAICPCFPEWMNLSLMTFVMCLFGFVLGAGFNIAFDKATAEQKADWLKIIYYPGEIWIYSLKLVVSPLISLMMVTLPDRVNVMGSQLGKHLVLFYIFTSSIAACEGLFWVNVIKPGDVTIYLDPGTKDAGASISELDSLLGIGRKAVPSNIITALESSNVLGLITFFLSLGAFMQSNQVDPMWRQTFMETAKAALKALMMVIPLIVTFTPFAMVSIITYRIAQIDDLQEILISVGKYILTVCVAQGIHMFLFYPLLLFVFARVNGWMYFSKIKRAPLTAFATSSSAATLPVSLDVLKRNDVKWQIVDFVAPLGSAINMDGTSCGFPIMCMWIAQMNNYDVDAGSQIVLALLSMTCSIGTAPIPNAGIVYVSMLLGSLGGPFEDDAIIATGVAFILIFDWFVDRVETMQNVWSDCVACKIFDAMGYDDLEKEQLSEMTEKDSKRDPSSNKDGVRVN